MNNLSPDYFAEIYVDCTLATLKNHPGGSMMLNDFYECVFQKVSEKTGVQREKIIYLHHAFHWTFFMGNQPPFELIFSKKEGEGYQINTKKGLPEKSFLISNVLEKHKQWLSKRMEKI